MHRPTPKPKEGLRKASHVIIYCWLRWTAWHDEAVALFVGNTAASTQVLAILTLLPTHGTALHDTTQCLDANIHFNN